MQQFNYSIGIVVSTVYIISLSVSIKRASLSVWNKPSSINISVLFLNVIWYGGAAISEVSDIFLPSVLFNLLTSDSMKAVSSKDFINSSLSQS